MPTHNDAVVIGPSGIHRASVIWLHGLGADGHDFEPVVPELGLPDQLGIRYIFPHAPVRPVTINGGMAMRAWYDVKSADLCRQEDVVSIEASSHLLTDYIDAEIALGIPSDHIVIAGFSQGGAIALHTGLRHRERLAGIMALSCYLPVAGTLAAEAHAANRGVPVFMAHGIQDPVVALSRALESRELLGREGYAVEWHEYLMPHSVCAGEIRDISTWLRRVAVQDRTAR